MDVNCVDIRNILLEQYSLAIKVHTVYLELIK